MARRRRAEKRRIKADPNYGDVDLARFINRIMRHGKRTTAQRIVYKALQQIEEQNARFMQEGMHEQFKKHVEDADQRMAG